MIKKKAFTVIELLVVVAIISILAAAAFVNYDKAQSKTRDAKRMSDLNTIAKAYQLYFQGNDSYAVKSGATVLGLKSSPGNGLFAMSGGTYQAKSLNARLMESDLNLLSGELKDPKADSGYSDYFVYQNGSATGPKCSIYAKLENAPVVGSAEYNTIGNSADPSRIATTVDITDRNYAANMIP